MCRLSEISVKQLDMKTTIVYSGKHGTTEKVASAIGEKLGDVELFPLMNGARPDLDLGKFDLVVLGTSVYAGRPLKQMTAFCSENEAILLQKRLGLYVCGMHPNREEQEKETQSAYPIALREKAVALAFLGGEFNFEAMNFFERMMVRMIAKTKTSVLHIDWEGVDRFAAKLRQKR